MREKLMLYIIACLTVTLALGVLLNSNREVAERLDADVWVNGNVETNKPFTEVIEQLDEFVQYCEPESAEISNSGVVGEVEVLVAGADETTVETTYTNTKTIAESEVKDVVAIVVPEMTTIVTTVPEAVTTTTAVVTTTAPPVTTTVATTTTVEATTTTKAETTTKATTSVTEKKTETTATTKEETVVTTVPETVNDFIDEDGDGFYEVIFFDDDDVTERPQYWTTTGGE